MDELSVALAAYRGTGSAGAQPARRQHVYADAGFWEARFQEQEGTFDWYATYEQLGSVFKEFCPPADDLRVLMVGCGNSSLSAELWHAGYRWLVNIDISQAAVAKMQELHANLDMEWRVMSATDMEFANDSFGLAVDKGTLDAMMCQAGNPDAAVMVAEIHRTLRPGGLFLLISHNGRRQELLDAAVEGGWRCLEKRKCPLSAQATLINVLRSKLKGRPLAEAFRDPPMMQEAAAETKMLLKRMAFLEAFRLYKAKKAREREPAEGASQKAEAKSSKEEGEEEPSGDPLLQPFCWAYVLQKPGT